MKQIIKVSDQKTFYTLGCSVSSILNGHSEKIEVSGGSVSINTNKGTATITAPNNFTSQETAIQIHKLDTSSSPDVPLGKNLINDNFFNLLAITSEGSVLDTFNQPVSFVIHYGTDVESTYQENTLDLYKYSNGNWIDQNCSLNTSENSLTCSLPGFSVYGVLGEEIAPTSTPTSTPIPTATINPTSTSSSKSSSDNSVSNNVISPSCNDSKSIGLPDLFQIETTQNSATIYFTPVNTSQYYISYSTSSSAEEHGVEVALGLEGVQNYTINYLLPETTYYFKVRSQNGCMPGDWSNIKSAKTKSQYIDNPVFNVIETVKEKLTPKKKIEVTEQKITNEKSSICSYITKPGDSYWSIAQNILGNGYDFIKIKEINNATSNVLSIGQELKLPCDKNKEIISKALEEAKQKGINLDILVKDNKNNPAEGVLVTLHSKVKMNRTDKNGMAKFTNVEPGKHKVVLSYQSYRGEQKINIDEKNKQQTLTLQVKMTNDFSLLSKAIIFIMSCIILVLLFLLWRKN